jgi:hypothetical protein
VAQTDAIKSDSFVLGELFLLEECIDAGLLGSPADARAFSETGPTSTSFSPEPGKTRASDAGCSPGGQVGADRRVSGHGGHLPREVCPAIPVLERKRNLRCEGSNMRSHPAGPIRTFPE